MKADLRPASIFNIPFPNEKFSLADALAMLKSRTTSSGTILDKCTFIFKDVEVVGPLEFTVQNSTIGSPTYLSNASSTKLLSSGSSTKMLSIPFSSMVLIESIILLSKLTLKPCRDEVIIRFEITLIF